MNKSKKREKQGGKPEIPIQRGKHPRRQTKKRKHIKLFEKLEHGNKKGFFAKDLDVWFHTWRNRKQKINPENRGHIFDHYVLFHLYLL